MVTGDQNILLKKSLVTININFIKSVAQLRKHLEGI